MGNYSHGEIITLYRLLVGLRYRQLEFEILLLILGTYDVAVF